MSKQIIENTEMPTENVAESQVAQNDEQGLVMSQDTVNNPSGKLDLLINGYPLTIFPR
jgi:hypothetical protein